MCRALFLVSDRPLPLIPQREYSQTAMSSPTWPREAQRFHTAELRQEQEVVRSQLSHPHVLYAGSYEGCGCGFNFGREYPDLDEDAEHLIAARESVAELVRYVREAGVREIYCCWFGDEAKPAVHRRAIRPEELGSQGFFFREQELITIVCDV
jgi:hypothetical protein